MEGSSASSGPHLRMSSTLHRPWYIPGDVVRAELVLECVPGSDAAHVDQLVPFPAAPLGNFYYADTEEDASTREGELLVRTLTATAEASCVYNSKVLANLEWGHVNTPALLVDPQADKNVRTKMTLFRTPSWPLTEHLPLSRRQCVALVIAFTLPEQLPPSIEGHTGAFACLLTFHSTWSSLRGQRVQGGHPSARPSFTTLQVPISVFSAAAVTAPVFVRCAFPLDRSHPHVRNAFDFMCIALPSVPSTSVSMPTQDALAPRQEEGEDSLAKVRQAAFIAVQARLAEVRTPLSIDIPLAGKPTMRVELTTSTLMLGSSVQGCFFSASLLGATSGDEDPVPVKAIGALEMLECCAVTSTSAIAQLPLVPGAPEMCVLSTSTVQSAEWVLLDTPRQYFSLSVAGGKATPTALTDVVSILWQLRLQICWTTRQALRRTSSSRGTAGASSPSCSAVQLEVQRDMQEVIVPLTVVPPRAPERPRVGKRVSSCS